MTCDGNEPWHGTLPGYVKHRCRGPACRAANAAYRRKERGGSYPVGPAWAGQGSYYLNPAYVPDTMTRGELLSGEGLRVNPRPPVVECYRTMIRDQYVCLERWPELWRKWCPGCGRMARVASRIEGVAQ